MYENYEKDLKKEIYLCHKNMNLSMEEIMNMSIRDRKYYIITHNKLVEKEIERLKSKKK